MSEPVSMADVAEEILAAFYDTRRGWTPGELAAAKRLAAAGWSASRAAFVVEWFRSCDDGKFWRDCASAKGGIEKVEKSREQIEEKSGAQTQAPRAEKLAGWYDELPPPAATLTRAELYAPWEALVEESGRLAHADGRPYDHRERRAWIFEERRRRAPQAVSRPSVDRVSALGDSLREIVNSRGARK